MELGWSGYGGQHPLARVSLEFPPGGEPSTTPELTTTVWWPGVAPRTDGWARLTITAGRSAWIGGRRRASFDDPSRARRSIPRIPHQDRELPGDQTVIQLSRARRNFVSPVGVAPDLGEGYAVAVLDQI